jgi:hypothetical protein
VGAGALSALADGASGVHSGCVYTKDNVEPVEQDARPARERVVVEDVRPAQVRARRLAEEGELAGAQVAGMFRWRTLHQRLRCGVLGACSALRGEWLCD